ncbi:P-loop NTPase fold protein [Pseudomonas orientalis]|uniref:P-loop NTPase fold protein n=1 Tax=Pseudomonas orientalis TaxID=76758 RepID=UPI003208DE2A
MQHILFQTEQPSERDLFPGGSHEKVADAICDYIGDESSSRVIGLDGEFGSGKSSILKMLEQKITKSSPNHKLWFFDCEQNYQGSIKSNFIELFTEELIRLSKSDQDSKKQLEDNRDKALGRHFMYTKKTTSRISSWAVLLIVTLFFSASSFRELFALTKLDRPVGLWIYALHVVSLLSPIITLGFAWAGLRKTKVGDQPWSIFYLFKGGSDDTITEKIQVAKEVTPLDLKRSLEADLKLFKDTHFIIVLDNLDRLPKDSLRSVWSDLEIFTWISEEYSLTTIVPFCSNKVAKYLGTDSDSVYDSKDFISKKFPVVFRAPPIIAAGWKDGFYKLWENTYPNSTRDTAEKCANMLQRHSPMTGKLVTPRLQKRFINDIATTSLILGSNIKLTSIAAHLLLCKYNDHPLEEIIRAAGLTDAYKKTHEEIVERDIVATQQLLETITGSSIENGWQIQFLQIHFLTTSDIAIAELIDVPLAASIEECDHERFISLIGLFGFTDALKRHLSNGGYNANLIKIINEINTHPDNDYLESIISIINNEQKAFTGEAGEDKPAFYNALKSCRLAGLNCSQLAHLETKLYKAIATAVNESIDIDSIDEQIALLREYDFCLDALESNFEPINIDNAAYFIHVFFKVSDLRVIKREHFNFSKLGDASILKHISSHAELADTTLVITEEQREFLLNVAFCKKKSGEEWTAKFTNLGISNLTRTLKNNPESNGALFGFAIHPTVEDDVLSFLVSQPFNKRSASQNAAACAIFLKAKNYEALSKIENLESVIDSNIFKLFFRAAIPAEALISGIDIDYIQETIIKILAWAINADAIWLLEYGYITENFTKLTNSLQAYSIDEDQLFLWLHDWQRHINITFDSIQTLDPDFVFRVSISENKLYSTLKASAKLCYESSERTEQEWISIINGDSPNHSLLIAMLVTSSELKLASTARTAIMGFLKTAATIDFGKEIGQKNISNIDTIISALDQTQKNLLGVELRNLIYTKSSLAHHTAWILTNFGELIVDIQPSNTLEVGKLMELLEFLYESSTESQATLAFLDGRAIQISTYNFSKELRKAMAVAVAKLNERAPALLQAFSEKKEFKSLMNDLMASDKDDATIKHNIKQSDLDSRPTNNT